MAKIKMVRGDQVKYAEHDWQIAECEAAGFAQDKPKKAAPKKKPAPKKKKV